MEQQAPTTVLPLQRIRYRSKHRATDQELVAVHWTMVDQEKSSDASSDLLHVDHATPKVQKKWKRAVKAHKSYWSVCLKSDIFPLCSNAVSANNDLDLWKTIVAKTTKLIDDMQSKLPKVSNNKTLTDSDGVEMIEDGPPKDFRCVADILFRAHFWRAAACHALGDQQETIRYVDKALAFFPPLQQRDELPLSKEVFLHAYRACAIKDTDLDGALRILRSCAAALRLLIHTGKFDPGDIEGYFLPNIVDTWVRTKIGEDGPKRPLFSYDERIDIEKELGIGIYSNELYKCLNCKKGPNGVQLLLCSRCRYTWYCGDKCRVKGWKEHKKICKKGIRLNNFRKEDVVGRIKQKGGVYIIIDPDADGSPQLLHAYCYDTETDQVFEALTDLQVEFTCLPAQEEQRETKRSNNLQVELPCLPKQEEQRETKRSNNLQVEETKRSDKQVFVLFVLLLLLPLLLVTTIFAFLLVFER